MIPQIYMYEQELVMIINEFSLGMLLTAKKIHYSSYMSISSQFSLVMKLTFYIVFQMTAFFLSLMIRAPPPIMGDKVSSNRCTETLV